MRLTCPWCGERDASEFTYRGDATASRPDFRTDMLDDTGRPALEAYVFDRANPAGEHVELWNHTGGCRTHVRVVRDTTRHRISRFEAVGPFADMMSGDDA